MFVFSNWRVNSNIIIIIIIYKTFRWKLIISFYWIYLSYFRYKFSISRPGGTVGWLWNLRSEWTTRRPPYPSCTRRLSSPTTIGLNRTLPDVLQDAWLGKGAPSPQSGPPTHGRSSRNGTPRRGRCPARGPRVNHQGTPQPCRLSSSTTTRSSSSGCGCSYQ